MEVTYNTASGAKVKLSLVGTKLSIQANDKDYSYRQLINDAKLGLIIECYDLVKITVPADQAAAVKEITSAHLARIVEKHQEGYYGRADAVDQRIAACGGADSI